MYGVRLDRFSSIDHLTKQQLQDDDTVLEVLRRCPRVSTFEMSESVAVRSAVERLIRSKKIEYNDKYGYPWHGITVLVCRHGTEVSEKYGCRKCARGEP